MPKSKEQAVFGVNSFTQAGIKNMFAKLASVEVEKVVVITKNGGCTVIQPTTNTESHHIQEIEGVFDNILVIKKGQSIDVEKNAIKISSENDSSFLENLINTVRDKVELVRPGLSFPDTCEIVVGVSGTLKEYLPKANSPQEYADKVLPGIFKEYRITQPTNSKLDSISQSFQIIVPGAYREVGFDGKVEFAPSKTMLFVEVSVATGSEKGNPQQLSHKISVSYLDFKGNKQSYLGNAFFDWKMSDPTITPNQVVFGGNVSNNGEMEENDYVSLSEKLMDEETDEDEETQPINGKKKVSAR